jgi:hypothetical protein
MHIVNNTIDQIGWTPYQTKVRRCSPRLLVLRKLTGAHICFQLFFLNGFGYAVDSLILLLQSITAGQAALEFRP